MVFTNFIVSLVNRLSYLMEERDTLLEKLKSSPDAVLLIHEFQQSLEEERKEREKFYELIHEDCKAEFINGKTIFQSPVKMRHWKVSMRLSALLHDYVTKNQLGEVGVEKVMISLTRNDYEPDICFFTAEKAKGFTEDQMLFPAPDFIVEITSPSTEKTDRGEKFVDYAAHGIPEYWIVDPEKQSLEQYTLTGHHYELLQKLTKKGSLSSEVINGFFVDLTQLFA